ncbi:MAG: pyridoxamine 5'-phosphate oxidase family protein [Anaerolineales bacterium]|nr:pyridoxamine 5'-phosphate oxidase family protein [Anaerolineales bacterium]
MRIKNKEINDRKTLDSIIHNAEICHLACCLNDQPYVIPISFGYDGKTIYFHTARAGKKNEIFLKNPQVSLGFETNIDLITDQDNACGWTFDFQSVIVTGEIKEINDPDLKNFGLNHIMLHYSNRNWNIPQEEIRKTKTWQVRIDTITGKRSPAKTSTKGE